ncbi:MAG TPA: 2-phospho-L-lactate guanylyltransferase [Polyangia bacterium]|nr:2-phospho-L-lactate guanylyltransferase [Polyangia bacterium]
MSGDARRVWAVVPAKCFRRGKSRLAAMLPDDARARLARSLFDRVVRVAGASPRVAGVVVATDCLEVAERARRAGASALIGAAPLRPSVDVALGALAAAGAGGALVLMSDLPRLEPDDVTELLRLLDDHEIVVAPDARDEGSNALALRLPSRITTCFGHDDSFARHVARARAAGLTLAEYRHARTGFDVDLPRDLRQL